MCLKVLIDKYLIENKVVSLGRMCRRVQLSGSAKWQCSLAKAKAAICGDLRISMLRVASHSDRSSDTSPFVDSDAIAVA